MNSDANSAAHQSGYDAYVLVWGVQRCSSHVYRAEAKERLHPLFWKHRLEVNPPCLALWMRRRENCQKQPLTRFTAAT